MTSPTRLPRFKTTGEILMNPTLEALRAAASACYGAGWGRAHNEALEALYLKMNDGSRDEGKVSNDRITIEWKLADDEDDDKVSTLYPRKPDKIVNVFAEPLLESDRRV